MARPRTTRRQDQQIYIANESFVANIGSDGKVKTDGSGQDKSFHAGLTRVYEDDAILDACPQNFDLLEDHMAVHDRTV
jgi:hypothetical protein